MAVPEYTSDKDSLLTALVVLVVLLILAVVIIYILYLTGVGAPPVIVMEVPDEGDGDTGGDSPIESDFTGIKQQNPPVVAELYIVEESKIGDESKGQITLNRIGTMVTISWTNILLDFQQELVADIDAEFTPIDVIFYETMTALQTGTDAFTTPDPRPVLVSVIGTKFFMKSLRTNFITPGRSVASGSITYSVPPTSVI